MKKKIILPVLTILGVALILVGTSYAYWKFTYISDKTNIGKSKCLSIELTNQKNEISLTNTYPISDIEGKKLTPYSFTINNTCDTLISYDVNLEMLEGTTMNSKYMAVMVNNEHKELLSNLDNANTVMSSSVESRKLVSGSLGVGDSVDYTLRLWMDESVTLSDDAMNKNFTSKIVVTAQPSNYSPKEAGYDTLHDAILANEYQTTPEKAIEKIKAKGEPDLSKTAPIIKWVEKTGSNTTVEVIKPAMSAINSDSQTANLTSNDTVLMLYKTKKFNSETSYYNLSDGIYADPTTIDFSGDVKYYFCSEMIYYLAGKEIIYTSSNTSDATVYQVTGATKYSSKAIWNNIEYDSITYKLNLITFSETATETNNSDKGLYHNTDDYGTTYYYRGNVKNNNVYFAGFYWQIVRINGDSSIRLIYNGAEKASSGLSKSINKKLYNFNNFSGKPVYVSYMYGNPDGTTYDDIYANKQSSRIKNVVDDWYKINILNNGYDNYINIDAGFCSDRSIYQGDGIDTGQHTRYGGFKRYYNNSAKFMCPNSAEDLYTVSKSNIGNKSLIYPIGLITYDELLFAGINRNSINKLSWIYSDNSYWTMTPSHYDSDWNAVLVFHQNGSGRIFTGWDVLTYNLAVRVVINLNADVKISGGIGTVNDPYVVDTNN